MKEIAVITGASSGIGYEIAKLFAKDQTDILIVARDERKLLRIKNEFEDIYCFSIIFYYFYAKFRKVCQKEPIFY